MADQMKVAIPEARHVVAYTPAEYKALRGPFRLEVEQTGAGADLAFHNVLVFTGTRRPPKLIGTDWSPRRGR